MIRNAACLDFLFFKIYNVTSNTLKGHIMVKIKNKKLSFGMSAVFVAFFSSVFLFSNSTYATYSIGISSNGVVDLGDIMPTPNSGALSNTGSDNVSILTNCSAGYNIYATGANGGSTSLVDSEHGSSIPTSANSIISPNVLDTNTWGLVTGSGSTPTTFSGLPNYTASFSTISPIYTAPANPDVITRNDNISVYYSVNVDMETIPGNYVADVLYTVVMNDSCAKYILNFDGNGATINNLEEQTINFGDTVSLSQYSTENKISRAGFHLSGWKIKIEDITSEATYPTNANIVLDNGSSSEVTLVAQWEANPTHTVTINGGPSILDCSNTVHPTATTSCRMPDGKVWIFGNDNDYGHWNDLFTNATDVNGHDATLISGKCPSGFAAPKKSDYDNLISAAGANRETFINLGIPSWGYYSSTEAGIDNYEGQIYELDVPSEYASQQNVRVTMNGKGNVYHKLLCLKEDDSPIISVSGSGTYRAGETVDITTVTNTTYHFESWTVSLPSDLVLADSTSSSTSFTMPDADVVVMPNVTSNPQGYYSVSISKGSNISKVTGAGFYKPGDTVNISATASAGYHFNQWVANTGNINLSNYSAETSFIMPSGNVAVTAESDINTYSFEYNANGGSGQQMSANSALYNEQIVFKDGTYTKNGYNFRGWSLSPSGSIDYYPGTSYNVASIVEAAGKGYQNHGTITMYAVWTEKPRCLMDINGCRLADGRTWTYASPIWPGSWDSMSSHSCSAGYSMLTSSIYKSLINSYGGSNGTLNNGRLYEAMELTEPAFFYATNKYNSSQVYYMNVADNIANVMYNPIDYLGSRGYFLCYK